MTASFTLFRLRSGTTICGYMKVHANGSIDYSKDRFWWHGTPIEYDKKDQFSGQLDRHNRPLFVNDLVAMRTTTATSPKSNCLLLFDTDRNGFILLQIDTNNMFELFLNDQPLFHKNELTFIGFSPSND